MGKTPEELTFEFPVTYAYPSGLVMQVTSRSSTPPEQWTAADVGEILSAAAAYSGIDLTVALAHFQPTPDGLVIQIGTEAAGSATVGPLPIRYDAAYDQAKKWGWFSAEEGKVQ